MPAYQFNVTVNGFATVTQGELLDWAVPPYVYVAPLGMMTRGLLIGLGDEWRYADTSGNAAWALSDTSANPGWVVNDI